MKKQFKKRLVIPVAVALVAIIAVSGVAYAYWTAGGSGAGTGTTAAGVSVTVNQTTTLNPMYPGLAAQTIGGNFTNTTGAPVFVPSVTASIASVTKAGVPVAGCDATDFTLAPTALVGTTIPNGTGVGAWGNTASPAVLTMTIQFNNKATNQDACKGATVNLTYSIP